MATKGNTVPEKLARWKVIHAAINPTLPEMPHLSALHTELGNVIARSEELDARNEALKAEAREVNRIRLELAATGDDLRNRLGAAIQTLHGFKSEKLIEFGLKPRRARGRDRKPRTSKKPGAQAAAPPQPPETAVGFQNPA